VLVVLNSGNGFSPVAGSIASFDDFEMIYNSPLTNTDQPAASRGFMYVEGRRLLVLKGMQQGMYQAVSIRDITGKLVWNGHVTDDRIDISPANLSKGIYLFSLTGNGEMYSQKIMVP
jgi:hypothetical protein